ncbi:hypothetical protein [Natranaerobius thermophilus]|uniref:Uncharacterized protein n=1 Tax=Natranaerobius thermophilus (strain ATCC BAA-1301 / DSM 18059 / JW/NM-WN-LF) TaxID=457570 RepID=B2A1R5_NATTJ|nr:hypothetical protein [Natranaerobius thermophilus]ACB86112.1 hypothetical protein Nther_2553 [Natranaerobius thermophilus JW/NM-WN-LF]
MLCFVNVQPNDIEQEVYDLANQALQCKDDFKVITDVIYFASNQTKFNEIIGDMKNEVEDSTINVIEEFYDTTDIGNRRGDFVEILVSNGLKRSGYSKEKDCVPYYNCEEIKVYYNGKKLKNNIDIAFWKTDEAELFECKSKLQSFLKRGRNARDKVIYLNEISIRLEQILLSVNTYLVDLSENDFIFNKYLSNNLLEEYKNRNNCEIKLTHGVSINSWTHHG